LSCLGYKGFFFIKTCPLFKQVGLKGEAMNLASPNGITSVEWMQSALVSDKNQPLTWHKVKINRNVLKVRGNQFLAIENDKIYWYICRLILMLQMEMSRWHWTWRVWVKVKYGLMD